MTWRDLITPHAPKAGTLIIARTPMRKPLPDDEPLNEGETWAPGSIPGFSDQGCAYQLFLMETDDSWLELFETGWIQFMEVVR